MTDCNEVHNDFSEELSNTRCNDEIDLDKEEGLAMLLGGLSSNIMQNTAWCDEDEYDIPITSDSSVNRNKNNLLHIERDAVEPPSNDKNNLKNEEDCNAAGKEHIQMNWLTRKHIFDRSFCIDPTKGTLMTPPVKLVNMVRIIQ